jgi:D-tyrosyl-tRNA(Tyr) deacylase
LIQRVSRSEVVVGKRTISSTGPGILVLLGVGKSDTEREAAFLARKTAALRIFEDHDGKMNIPVTDFKGEVMVVSQFTLMADTAGGNRPGFSQAAGPVHAERLYESFISQLESMTIPVKRGKFGADMKVELVNDGPVTILLESK